MAISSASLFSLFRMSVLGSETKTTKDIPYFGSPLKKKSLNPQIPQVQDPKLDGWRWITDRQRFESQLSAAFWLFFLRCRTFSNRFPFMKPNMSQEKTLTFLQQQFHNFRITLPGSRVQSSVPQFILKYPGGYYFMKFNVQQQWRYNPYGTSLKKSGCNFI